MNYRGIIHFHSDASYDSFTGVAGIIRFAQSHRMNFLVLTDHDSIEGSRRLRREVERLNLEIEVPLAAEYHTEFGDVVAAFLTEEVRERSFDRFVLAVREQGGILMLPHPYAAHPTPELFCEQMDLIEVFNSRCSEEQNRKAAALASRFAKKAYYSPDAHFVKNMSDAVVEIERQGDLRNSLLNGRITPVQLRGSSRRDCFRSQLIKGLRRKDPKLLAYASWKILTG